MAPKTKTKKSCDRVCGCLWCEMSGTKSVRRSIPLLAVVAAIWLCPGPPGQGDYNDLHYFDIQDVFLFSWVVVF